MSDGEAMAQAILMFFLLPLWLVAGVADWQCHRLSDIEHTAGLKESLLHVLMFVEVGVPLVAALLLEVNATLFGLMVVAFLLHEATALWDVRLAVRRRRVSPWEQHVHSFLELLPLMAILLLVVLEGDRLLPLDWGLVPRRDPLPTWYLVAFACSAVLLSVVPYANEVIRCVAARRVRPTP